MTQSTHETPRHDNHRPTVREPISDGAAFRFVLTEMSRRVNWKVAAVLSIGPLLATPFLPSAWPYNTKLKLDAGFYYALGAFILALMFAYLAVVPRPHLPPDARRLHVGALTGLSISAIVACLLCFALGLGLPPYLPFIVYIAIVGLQAIIAGAAFALARSLSE